jgi:hypothetical protein
MVVRVELPVVVHVRHTLQAVVFKGFRDLKPR